jgi:hypothetical protein
MENDRQNSNKKAKIALRFLWLGAIIGFVLGVCFGLFYNPPFPGILSNKSDTAGLSIVSWFFFGLVGGVCGFFFGPMLNYLFSRGSRS